MQSSFNHAVEDLGVIAFLSTERAHSLQLLGAFFTNIQMPTLRIHMSGLVAETHFAQASIVKLVFSLQIVDLVIFLLNYTVFLF